MKPLNSPTSTVSCGRAILGCLVMLGAQAVAAAPPADEAVWVGRFQRDLAPWQEVRLNDKLRPNEFTLREWDGASALKVRSSGSMSLLARPVEIDLQRTPVLCWRWRIDAPLKKADMTHRSGDDYAARLYVSLALPERDKSFGLRAQLSLARSIWGPSVPDAAVNYVWDNQNPIGTERPNAYTDRATMIVLRSGAGDAGRWVQERRNVGRDVARLYGASARPVQLALTADTDNTGETARAGFADLHWVPEQAPCHSG